MTLTNEVAKNIIKKLIHGDDYRIEVVTLINTEFLQEAMIFFKEVVNAKLANKNISLDWYKETFINKELPLGKIATNSGLNKKTIMNMYNSATKEIVLEASLEHYETLQVAIQNLIDHEDSLNINLIIKLRNVSVELSMNESLIVINALAVKRAALRGGLWSTAGKRVEKPLMISLCKLFEVSEQNYDIVYVNGKKENDSDFEREIDFYLRKDERRYKCEVKLMGRGNPESADAVIARDSSVFIADKLSDTNKKQLNSLNVQWVELRDTDGFKKFQNVLKHFKIPHSILKQNIEIELEKILNEIFYKN